MSQTDKVVLCANCSKDVEKRANITDRYSYVAGMFLKVNKCDYNTHKISFVGDSSGRPTDYYEHELYLCDFCLHGEKWDEDHTIVLHDDISPCVIKVKNKLFMVEVCWRMND